MAKHELDIDLLSLKSIDNGIQGLIDYQEYLQKKAIEYVKALADVGIMMAETYSKSSYYGRYVLFYKEVKEEVEGATAIMYGTNTGVVTASWKIQNNEVKSVDVSPILMLEFGSGFKAQNPANVSNVGQGTFPGQTHAQDPGGWSWMDLDGNWHHSTGTEAHLPMYRAMVDMMNNIVDIARLVFE